MPWRPGRRDAALLLEEPYEDVPDHLYGPLQSWVMGYLSEPEVLYTVGVILRVAMPDPRAGYYKDALRSIELWINAEDGRLLDLTETLLATYRWNGGASDDLDHVLTLGNSAYRVNDGASGLEMRVTPEVKEQVQAAVAIAAGSAGAHLASAWNEAYGRQQDPVKSYSESIKAVESAAAPVISPNNLRATLGTILGELRANPGNWSHVVSPGNLDATEAMMSMLWGGQTSRHGGVTPTVPETPEAAQAAVHLAATLVQWFSGGAIS